MITHSYGNIELEKMINKVISWTGLIGDEAYRIALITIEYRKPNHGSYG